MDYIDLHKLHGLQWTTIDYMDYVNLMEYMDKIYIVAAIRSSRLDTLGFRVIMEPGPGGTQNMLVGVKN